MQTPQQPSSSTGSGSEHVPVLLNEVLAHLSPTAGAFVVDGTAGGGGHLRALLQAVQPGGSVLGIDRDPGAIQRLEQELAGQPVKLACTSYSDLPYIMRQQQMPLAAAILLDLGLSSDQLADPERGFSFNIDGPLDLRFNPHAGEPAYRLIQRISAEHLADLIFEYGEERLSRQIARAIVEARRQQPIRSSAQLAQIIRKSVGSKYRNERIDPATRTFQALRIAVNGELRELEIALRHLPDCLEPGGRLGIISFHSLEDRRVKTAFRHDERLEVLTRKPIRPDAYEISSNSRSRSAKLRVARRIPA